MMDNNQNEQSKNGIIVGLGVLVVILIVIIIVMAIKMVEGKQDNDIVTNQDNINDTNSQVADDNQEILARGKELYDKATEVYGTNVVIPYCGLSYQQVFGHQNEFVSFKDQQGYEWKYYKTPYHNASELKDDLRHYFADNMVNQIVHGDVITEFSEFEQYTDYIVRDNTLYCRTTSGKGWVTGYVDYEMEVADIQESQITYNIKSRYAINDGKSRCFDGVFTSGDTSSCKDSDFEFKTTTFTISKNISGNWVVSQFKLHD